MMGFRKGNGFPINDFTVFKQVGASVCTADHYRGNRHPVRMISGRRGHRLVLLSALQGKLLVYHLVGITTENNTRMHNVGRGLSLIGDDHHRAQMRNLKQLGGKFQGQMNTAVGTGVAGQTTGMQTNPTPG